MSLLLEPFFAIRDFFEAGGDVLYGILVVATLMWTFIIERLWYLYGEMPKRISRAREEWDSRDDTTSWYARRIRDLLISEISLHAKQYLLMIKTLMAVLPLLGLLGTVTGMIQVFDVMAVTGTSNARLMAGGVSAATIPTMAGLVAALSGVYAVTFLENKASAKIEQAEDLLLHH
jgi:biopolymer transport protein ExbB